MKNGGLRFARPPYGLSTHVDLKLVSRLEFGSGAVAVRHEPGTVRAGRINRPLCMLRPGSPACAILLAILPGLPSPAPAAFLAASAAFLRSGIGRRSFPARAAYS